MSMMTDCRVSNQRDADNVLNATAVNFGNDGKMIVLPVPGVSGDLRNVCVRLADSVTQRNSARMLINKMYAWRGYGENHNIPARPTHSTFTASDGDVLIGTLTLAVDSHTGLAADAIFQEEIDVFRRQSGAKVCELTKLAFNSTVPSKPMLAALFHIVFIYGQRKHRCTDLFIEVHPRHRRFYQAMLGFKPIGEVKNQYQCQRASAINGTEDRADPRANQPICRTRRFCKCAIALSFLFFSTRRRRYLQSV